MSNDQILVRIRKMKCQGKDKGGDTSPVAELNEVLVKPKFHLRFSGSAPLPTPRKPTR